MSSWHRQAVGGMWRTIGPLQFDFLVSRGLKPEHTLLDVGCGAFRGGIHFLRYLNDGNYIGLDENPDLIRAGMEVEIPKAGLNGKSLTTVINSDFDLSGYDGRFDYALAHSLFIHLPKDQIRLCVVSVWNALKNAGRFYASYFQAPYWTKDEDRPPYSGGVITHWDKDQFHQEIGFYEGIASDLGMQLKDIGDWNHPRGQRILELTK